MTQHPSEFPDVSGLDLRSAAVAYAEAGFVVGPFIDSKNPGSWLGKDWPSKTSGDPARVAAWFDGPDGYEINGIFLHVGRSGLVCLDIDADGEVPDVLTEAERDHPPATQVTREDGTKRHLVYRTDLDLGNSRGSLGKGWGDVRGRNGVIVLEPSPHSKPEGLYRWVRRSIPELPGSLASALTDRPGDPFDTGRSTGTLTAAVPHGRRDDEMHRYACRLRAKGLDHDEALALLRTRAEAFDNADGRVTEEFLRTKLDNAWKYPAGTTAQIAVEALEPSPEGDEPFWKARDELEHLRAFALARRVSPWAVLGVTLARVLCATPPTVVLPPTIGSRASLNTFIALAGGSGDSKTTSAAVSFDAVLIEGEPDPLPLGSGEGVPAMFVQHVPKTGKGADATPAHYEQYRTRAFAEVDEIKTIGAISSRGGSTLGDTLRRAWSGATLGNHNRAQETRLIVPKHAYRFCMWVGVQPGAAGILLNPDEESFGTPQRFLWIRAKRDLTRAGIEQPDPLNWSLPALPDLDQEGFADEEGWSWEIPLCAEAVKDIIDADTARATGDDSDPLDGHVLLCRTKVAAALALFNGRWAVEEEDWSLAGLVMEHSNACRTWLKAYLAAEAVKASKAVGQAKAVQEVAVADALDKRVIDRVAKRLLKLLVTGPMTQAEINRSIAGRDKHLVPEALERLGDKIKKTESPGGHGNTIVTWELS